MCSEKTKTWAAKNPYLLTGLACFIPIASTSVIADEATKKETKPDEKVVETRDSELFREFLRSMTITPFTKKAFSPAEQKIAKPKPSMPTQTTEASISPPQPLTTPSTSLCNTCGSSLLNGACSGKNGPCLGDIGSSSSGLSGSNQANSGQAGKSAMGPMGSGLKSSAPINLGSMSSGQKYSGQTSLGQKGAAQVSGHGQPPPSKPMGNTQAAVGSAQVIGSAGSISGGVTSNNASSAILGTIPGSFAGNNARSSYIPLGWEVVRPAGAGDADWQTAIAMTGNEVDDESGDDSARRLDAGNVKGSLQTGPTNLLILPPDVASVVYVLDCSSSMSGHRFQQAQSSLVDAIAQMNPNQRFALILFNEMALQIRGGGYRYAGPIGGNELLQELKQIQPDGGTDPADALLLAIQLKPDALVVLSDGEFGDLTVDRVSRLNRSGGKNTQINCIAIGTHVQTLKRLAALNGPGNYIEVQ